MGACSHSHRTPSPTGPPHLRVGTGQGREGCPGSGRNGLERDSVTGAGTKIFTVSANHARQGLANFLSKGSNNKYFRRCRPFGFCHHLLSSAIQCQTATDKM